MIIVDKPALWLSTPGRDPKTDERPVLGLKLQEQLQRQIFPIHRLDLEVTGIIMYGKTPAFHKTANSLFEQRKIKKTYQALTPLTPFAVGEIYVWKSSLLRGKKRAYEAPYGKPAETHAQILAQKNRTQDWRLNPITGRAHQLRYEMFKHNAPIHGDALYGSDVAWNEGIALRAVTLDLPEDFASQWGLQTQYQVEPLSY